MNRIMQPLTETTTEAVATKQDLWLAYTPKACASLSIPSSLFIIYEAIQDHRVGKGTAIQRALVGMSIVDVCASFAWFLSTWAVNSNISDNPLARGNQATCNFQGFLLQLAVGAPLYNCSLALYYLLVIRYNWTNEQLVKIERFVHSFIILFTLSTSCIGLPLDMYNPTGTVCWVNGSPPNCDLNDDIQCDRGDHAWLFGIFLFYGPLWLCVIATIIAMIMIYIQVRRTFGKTRAYLYQDNQQRQQQQQQQQQHNHYWATTTAAGHVISSASATAAAAAAIVRASDNMNNSDNDDDDEDDDDNFKNDAIGGGGGGGCPSTTTYEGTTNNGYAIPLYDDAAPLSLLDGSRYRRLGSVFNIRSSIAAGSSIFSHQSFVSQQPSEDFRNITDKSNEANNKGGGGGGESGSGSAQLDGGDGGGEKATTTNEHDGAKDGNNNIDEGQQEKDHNRITNRIPSSSSANLQTLPTTSGTTAVNTAFDGSNRRREYQSASTRTTGSNTSERRRQRRYSKQNMFATQAILYSGSFFITWSPSTVWSIGHWFNFAGFGLDYLAALCEPLQGFWNMLIFIRRRPKSQQKILDVLCFWKFQCFRKAVHSANSSFNSSFRRSTNNIQNDSSHHRRGRNNSIHNRNDNDNNNSRFLSHHTSVEVMADEISDREFRDVVTTAGSSTATPTKSNIKRDSLTIHFEDEKIATPPGIVVENGYPNHDSDDDDEEGNPAADTDGVVVNCDDDDVKIDAINSSKNNGSISHDKIMMNRSKNNNNDDDNNKKSSSSSSSSSLSESSLSSSTPQAVPSSTIPSPSITKSKEEGGGDDDEESNEVIFGTADGKKKVPISSRHFNDSTEKTVAEKSM